jgi:hypothetical protein
MLQAPFEPQSRDAGSGPARSSRLELIISRTEAFKAIPWRCMGAVLEVELVGVTSFGVQKGAGGSSAHQLEH